MYVQFHVRDATHLTIWFVLVVMTGGTTHYTEELCAHWGEGGYSTGVKISRVIWFFTLPSHISANGFKALHKALFPNFTTTQWHRSNWARVIGQRSSREFYCQRRIWTQIPAFYFPLISPNYLVSLSTLSWLLYSYIRSTHTDLHTFHEVMPKSEHVLRRQP